MSIDLHIHSNHSDGTLSPSEIVQRAKKKGLTAIAITDHDTASATPEALEAGKKHGIEVVPGIELSVVHNGQNMHILGYFFDHESHEFQSKISVLQSARKERNKKIIVKLQQLGIAINYRDIINISLKGQTGRPHIAKALVNKGVVKNFDEAFAKYLGKGCVGYVSRFLYSAEEAIAIIKASGGLAVLAHPYMINSSPEHMAELVEELSQAGLAGIEAYYPSHSKAVRKSIKKLAGRLGLIVTGGSDYHGNIRPGTDMAGGINLFVPDDLLDKMKQKWIM